MLMNETTSYPLREGGFGSGWSWRVSTKWMVGEGIRLPKIVLPPVRVKCV